LFVASKMQEIQRPKTQEDQEEVKNKREVLQPSSSVTIRRSPLDFP
jgi:hypothetical protein